MMMRFLLALILFGASLTSVRHVLGAPKPPPNPPPRVIENDLQRQAVWDKMLDSGTNRRYWSALAGTAESKELWYKVVATILGVITFGLPLIFRPWERKWTVGILDLLSLIALCVSIVFLLDTSADYNQLSTLAKRWGSLQTQWELLYRERDNLPHEQLKGRVEALVTQEDEIQNSEPQETDHHLLCESQRAELIAQGYEKWATDHIPMDTPTGK